jgi:hypothetical protein
LFKGAFEFLSQKIRNRKEADKKQGMCGKAEAESLFEVMDSTKNQRRQMPLMVGER